MFQRACQAVKDSLYGVKCKTTTVGSTLGSGFVLSPGVIVTCAHVLHLKGDVKKPMHESFQVIQESEIGKRRMDVGTLIAEDTTKDIALLGVEPKRSNKFVRLELGIANIGTSCGTLGFPLAFVNSRGVLRIDMQFQIGHISSYHRDLGYYEVNYSSYHGSSGSPGFTVDGKAIGMHKGPLIPKYLPDKFIFSYWVSSPQIKHFVEHNGIEI